MKKTLAVLLLLVGFAVFPANSYAQGAKFTNYGDGLQLGVLTNPGHTDLKPLSGILLGYHFTTVELGRWNTLGFGVGWTITDEPKYPRVQTQGFDFALTTSQSIRLSDYGPGKINAYLSVTYGYNLYNRTQGIYFGFSAGGR